LTISSNRKFMVRFYWNN